MKGKGIGWILLFSSWSIHLTFVLGGVIVFVGGALNSPGVASMGAALSALSACSWTQLENGGAWEMTILTMPISRKGLVLARYIQALAASLVIGWIYMLAFRVLGNGADDGSGLMLMGYAMIITSLGLLLLYVDWDMELKKRLMSPLMMLTFLSDSWILRYWKWHGGDYRASLETGWNWLWVSAAVMLISLIASLILERKREW